MTNCDQLKKGNDMYKRLNMRKKVNILDVMKRPITLSVEEKIEELEKRLASMEEVVAHNFKRLNEIQGKPENYRKRVK